MSLDKTMRSALRATAVPAPDPRDTRIAELEARVVDLEVFVHAVSASTKTQVDADNWREWKAWADELIK